MDTAAQHLARHRQAANLPERLRWGAVRLSVTDLDRAEAFWTTVLGFVRRPDEGPGLALGTPDRTLVVLVRGATSPVARGYTGLYHVAFGMPTQAEFSRCLQRVVDMQVPFSPVDHLISKAFYLNDPDGHGIEITLETPERLGRFGDEAGRFAMYDVDGRRHSGRAPLDVRGELAQADGTDPGLAVHRDAYVAHLHLHVPAIDPALDWFTGLGFARNLRLLDFGMADMGAGGPCTHRLAVNIWAGQDIGPAPHTMARLLSYDMITSDVDCFAAARTYLTGDMAAGLLTGTDPAGVTATLRLERRRVQKQERAA